MPFKPPAIVKQIPIFRFLLAMALGIIVQYNAILNASYFWIIFCCSIAFVAVFSLLPTSKQFVYRGFKGIGIILCFVGLGGLLSFYKNDINNPNSFVNNYNKEPVFVELLEDISKKPKSYKANAKIIAVFKNNEWKSSHGKIIIYTKIDSAFANLKMGDALVLSKPLTTIVNSGNPGGYNYARFCSFQSIYHQIYITNKEVQFVKKQGVTGFKKLIYNIQHWVLSVLKQYIKDANALGIAEALLIGYREDLDKDLVKAYSNTGVVHIIAISGMHLGMIYWLLLLLLKPISKTAKLTFFKALIIILVLWLFSAVAGMGASIVRSAIMFSFIALGESFNKKYNIYNSLALSAFIIVLFEPFALWDVGFQLSYAAVLSIALFSTSIKKWFYFKNKLLQLFFGLNAVTLSAQVLTLPIVLYHFHQFPTYFLITNLIAVPISSIILFSEIALLLFAFFTPIATFLGNCINSTINWLNNFIIASDTLPFAAIENVYVSINQAVLLMFTVLLFGYGLLHKNKKLLYIGLGCFSFVMCLRMVDVLQKQQQQKIIIYNVPSFTAVDIINGKNFTYVGDSILQKPGFLQNFHIKPSRILHRLQKQVLLDDVLITNNIIQYKNKKILVINKNWQTTETPINVDVVLVTQNPKLYLNQLKNITTKVFVFDGSNPMWKIELWQKDCINLHLPHHITALQGAYEINCM